MRGDNFGVLQILPGGATPRTDQHGFEVEATVAALRQSIAELRSTPPGSPSHGARLARSPHESSLLASLEARQHARLSKLWSKWIVRGCITIWNSSDRACHDAFSKLAAHNILGGYLPLFVSVVMAMA